MRIIKTMNWRNKNRTYYKHELYLSSRQLAKLGWKAGTNVKTVIGKKGTLIVKRKK